MKAIINGVTVEGSPQEIMEYQRLQEERAEKPFKYRDAGDVPWQYLPKITCGGTVAVKSDGTWGC